LAGTGNNLDLATSTNYNLRYDGAAAGDQLGTIYINAGDYDGDGKNDVAVSARSAGNNSRSGSGSVYLINGNLLRSYGGTGNTINLATSTNYNIRYDGAAANDALVTPHSGMGDLNNNRKADLVMGAVGQDNNNRSNSGSVYIVYDNMINSLGGTGNNVDMANANNYSLRIDGAVANDQLAGSNVLIGDIDMDGRNDLWIGTSGADVPGKADVGALWIIANYQLAGWGTGRNIDLLDSNNFLSRYDGAVVGDGLSSFSLAMADINGDGKNDILVGAPFADFNNITSSGSMYVILNNPAKYPTVTFNDPVASPIAGKLRITGRAQVDSPYTIKSVQYILNGATPVGAQPLTGYFDSGTEDFYFDFDPKSTSYTIRIRVYNNNAEVTDNVFYFQPFTLDSVTATFNPQFTFSLNKARIQDLKDNLVRFRVLVKGSKDREWRTYIDNIPVDYLAAKDGSNNISKILNIYETQDIKVEYLDGNTRLRVISKTSKLLPGLYQTKVQAVDKSGHVQYTNILNLNLKRAVSVVSLSKVDLQPTPQPEADRPLDETPTPSVSEESLPNTQAGVKISLQELLPILLLILFFIVLVLKYRHGTGTKEKAY
jgi:hypothetical protein